MSCNLLKIKNNIFKVFIELFIFDKVLRSKLKARWAKKILKKYALIALKEPFKEQNKEPSNIIWQYWHQGIENAPEVVKKCLESVKRQENNKQINVVTFDTIKNYIDLPQRYYDLLNSGKMPIAHFSDILRLYLLEKYGGTWIDSTIYLTEKLPDKITNLDFFVIKKDPKKCLQENTMFCFFIHAKKMNINIQAIKRALEAYWAENDFVVNYFMFEHLETLLWDKTPELKAQWEKMPFYDITDELMQNLYKKFDQVRLNEISSKFPFHKLTYKKSKKLKNIEPDNFLSHL